MKIKHVLVGVSTALALTPTITLSSCKENTTPATYDLQITAKELKLNDTRPHAIGKITFNSLISEVKKEGSTTDQISWAIQNNSLYVSALFEDQVWYCRFIVKNIYGAIGTYLWKRTNDKLTWEEEVW